MTAIAISPIFNKIDQVYQRQWWNINPFETLWLTLEGIFVIPVLLWQASRLVREINKLVQQINFFDKELFTKIYEKLSQVRDIHLNFRNTIDHHWAFRIYSSWNDRIIADIDDTLEDIYFAMDEEFRTLVEGIADKI